MPQGYEPGWLGRIAFGAGYKAPEVSAEDIARGRRLAAIMLVVMLGAPAVVALIVWLISHDLAVTIVAAIVAFVVTSVAIGVVAYRLDKRQLRP